MSRVAAMRVDPAAVDRYLLPREVRAATVRRHPAWLCAPLAEALGVLLVALVISFSLREERPVKVAVWLIAAAVLLGVLYILVNWTVTYYAITSERILFISGVGSRSVKMILLDDVRDLEFTRSFAGRLLGYGSFKSESGKVIFDFLPYPEQLYLIMCRKILKDADDDEQVSEDHWPGMAIDEAAADDRQPDVDDDGDEELAFGDPDRSHRDDHL